MDKEYKQNGPDFIRKGRVVKNLVTGERTKHEFINQAKRQSHKIQMTKGGLGHGSLVVKC